MSQDCQGAKATKECRWIMRAGLIACLLTVGITAGGAASAADEIALHPDVWAAYEAYRQTPRPGAFAVSEDGRSHGQSQCGAVCVVGPQKAQALAACREKSGGACLVFAVRDQIRLPYRLLSREELNACPLSPVPRIGVALTIGETGFERGYTVALLDLMMGADGRHWLDEDGTVMGLTRQFFDLHTTGIGIVESEGRDGVRCVGYGDGEIRLHHSALIYVAREIPEDTCLYREVLAHEHKHRALGAELAAGFARDLEARIAEALTEAPFVELPPGSSPRQVADERLNAIIDAAYATFERDRSRRQLGIDSQSEYDRVDLACPGEADRFLP